MICFKQHDVKKILPAANMSMSAASSMVMRAVPRLAMLGRLGSNVGQLRTPPRSPLHQPAAALLRRQDCSVRGLYIHSSYQQPGSACSLPGWLTGLWKPQKSTTHPPLSSCHPLPLPRRVKQAPSLTFLEGTLTFEETAASAALQSLLPASCS